ncbi:hypothetical protein I5Q45_04255 [Serratia marcescens]|nr:hypothetical protein [Serratia marcescens]
MRQIRTIIALSLIIISASASADKAPDNLKKLAVQVSETAKQIAKDTGGIKSAVNPITAQRDLHIRVAKLKVLAEPLGAAFDKPYGRCGAMATLLDGFVDASAGVRNGAKFNFDAYRTSERECEEQISGSANQSDEDIAVLDL